MCWKKAVQFDIYIFFYYLLILFIIFAANLRVKQLKKKKVNKDMLPMIDRFSIIFILFILLPV